MYDKRNDYDFEVINYPFLDGNIPKNKSYSVFISQLVRFARVNSSFNGFIGDCKNKVSKLSRQIQSCCFAQAILCVSLNIS